GSHDRTAEVARVGGAQVVREDQRGYGAACLRGLAELAAEPPDVVVFLDADYTDHPDELPALLQPLFQLPPHIVLRSPPAAPRATVRRAASPPRASGAAAPPVF